MVFIDKTLYCFSQEVLMARFKWILAAMFLVLGQAALAADDIEDDDTLTPTQKEQLKKVQENLALVTKDSKQTKGEKETALADSLRTVLVQNSTPSNTSID